MEKHHKSCRGEGSSTILKSAKMKIRDTNAFLPVNKKKSERIEIFFKWLIGNRRKVLNTMKTTNLYLSQKDLVNACQYQISSIENLVSTHEEADFRMMAHVKHALTHSNSPVIARSHSSDTDIFIMTVTSFHSTNLILDSGTGVGRKIVRMSDVEIEEDDRNANIGFHGFTGCDYTSAFFRKGKTMCWKKMESKARFYEVMTKLGEDVSVDLCNTIGEFVCAMYGDGRVKDVNTLQSNKFTEKQNRENKYVDL